MKIRSDFVTNSSSVSFILTMHKEMAELFSRNFESIWGKKRKKVYDFLHQDIEENGTRVMLEGKEIYSKTYTFNTDECLTEDSFDKPIEEIDFSQFSDEEMWSYIYGEYILDGHITELNGFGSTQVDTY